MSSPYTHSYMIMLRSQDLSDALKRLCQRSWGITGIVSQVSCRRVFACALLIVPSCQIMDSDSFIVLLLPFHQNQLKAFILFGLYLSTRTTR